MRRTSRATSSTLPPGGSAAASLLSASRTAYVVRAAVVAVALLRFAPTATAAVEAGLAADLAHEIVAFGSRPSGSEPHRATGEFLRERLTELGWQVVEHRLDSRGSANIEVVRRGRLDDEIVLAAHYDTVIGAPGAIDNAAGCAVVLAAAAQLEALPLHYSLRIVFFDGEELGLRGSRYWVRGLEVLDRDRILAALIVDTVGHVDDRRPAIIDLPARDENGRQRRTPGWLVHAVREAGIATGFGIRAGNGAWSLPVQGVLRMVKLGYGGDSQALLEVGIPAALLSDASVLGLDPAHHTRADGVERLIPERLDRWTDLLVASVLRLDRLGGRPLWEDEFLEAGRVWLRRDLLWIGFLLWVALALRSGLRPGRWKDADREDRMRRGRDYVPGFLFRLLFLIVALWIPALGALLVYPLGALGLWRPGRAALRAAWLAIGLLPAIVLSSIIARLGMSGALQAWDLSFAKIGLLVLTYLTFTVWLWSAERVESLTSGSLSSS